MLGLFAIIKKKHSLQKSSMALPRKKCLLLQKSHHRGAENSRKQIHDVLPYQKIEKPAKTDKIKTTRTSKK